MLITNGQTSLEQVWHPHRPMKNPTLTFNLDWIIQNDDDDDGGDAGGLGSIVGGRLMLKGSPNAQDPMRRRRPAFNRYRCIYLFCTDQDQPPPPPRPLTRTITLQDTKLCSFWDHLNAIYRITDHISLFHSTVLHSAKPGQNLWLLLSCSSLAPLQRTLRRTNDALSHLLVAIEFNPSTRVIFHNFIPIFQADDGQCDQCFYGVPMVEVMIVISPFQHVPLMGLDSN